MKNISCILLLVCLLFGGFLHAENVVPSGVDADTSFIRIDFAPPTFDWDTNDDKHSLRLPLTSADDEHPEHRYHEAEWPAFECALPGGSGGTIDEDEKTAWYLVTLKQLGFEDGDDPINLSGRITDCLQSAGIYDVTLHLEDMARNTNETTYRFYVRAGTPYGGENTLMPALNCSGEAEESTSIFANGLDDCDIELRLQDQYKNPVAQLVSASAHQIEFIPGGDWSTTKDANRGDITFQDGLLNAEDLQPFSARDLVLGDDVKATFAVKALAPSIEKVGTALARLVAAPLSFDIETKKIQPSGDASGDPLTFTAQANVQFRHPFELKPEQITPSLVWEDPADFHVNLADLGSGIAKSSLSYAALLGQNDDYLYLYKNEDGDPDTPDMIQFGDGDPTDTYLETNASTVALQTAIQSGSAALPEITINPGAGLYTSEDQKIGLSTVLEYQINGKKVAYPAGGLSIAPEWIEATDGDFLLGTIIGYDPDGSLKFIGVDVEGGILGDTSESYINGVNKAVLLGNINPQDVREVVTEGAFRLVRGAEAADVRTEDQTFTDLDTLFENRDVLIVKDADVTIAPASASSTGQVLPSGRNTLIILNGNLTIADNIQYDGAQDSFGVILINDSEFVADAEDGFTNGNIYVQSQIRTIAGTYYADGSFMTKTSSGLMYGSGLTEEMNDTQLILEGTVMANNTVGGALVPNLNNPTHFRNPWSDTVSQDIAKKYDLHYIRRFKGVTNKCAKPDGVNCDPNGNAFVIRIDRRAGTIPPPGFEEGFSFRGVQLD